MRTGNGTDDTYSVTRHGRRGRLHQRDPADHRRDGTTHSAACTVTVKESKTILDLIPGMNG